MIRTILQNGFSLNTVINLCAMVFVVFCVLPVHEFAHAWAATKLGDDTARLQGRLTLSPLAHIDWLGALMIFLVGFGYAKPVPVNPRNFKNPRTGMAITAAAGPLSNLLMALFFLLLSNGAYVLAVKSDATVAQVTYYFFYYTASINVSLAVFNLLPVPPLDGSRVVSLLLPSKYYFQIMRYERYIQIGILLLLFTGVLGTPLSYLSGWVMTGLQWLTRLPFRAFFG